MNPEFYFAHEYIEDAKAFLKEFDLEKFIVMPNRKPKLKPKNERVCRFCNKKYPLVSFHKDAHIISELLGNHHLVSDFECDDCNHKFGTTYEDHLAKFLGVSRTLQGLKGKRKVPAHKSPGNAIIAEKTDFLGLKDIINISRSDTTNDTMEFDPLTGSGSINFIKQSYKPLYVYKAFLKMALSCLDEKDMINYQLAIRYLYNDNFDEQLKGASIVKAYRMQPGFEIEKPYALLFRKKDSQSQIPTHIFALFFKDSAYEIFIPLNKNDLGFYNNSTFSISWCPPIFDNYQVSINTKVLNAEFDFSSKEFLKGEKETLKFQLQKEELEKLVSVNLESGEINSPPTKFHSISKLILTKNGDQIDLSKLKK